MAELKNEFSWSKSRAEMFSACPRQYYYHYYGSWGGWSPNANPKTRTLYILKRLMTRQQWIGATVHNCIRWMLDELKNKGALPPQEKTLGFLGRRLQKDFQASGEGLYWENPKEYVGLLEHEYDELDVEDERWRTLMQRALEMVANLYSSDLLRELTEVSPSNWLQIETLASFDVDGTKVYVQIDCAHRRSEGIRLIDWKTGKADTDETHEQLALYSWYASLTWKTEPSLIEAGEFNLRDGIWWGARFDRSDFEKIRNRIAESVAAMKALLDDPARNVASEERFPLAESEQPCRTCPFRRVCPRFYPADEG